MDRNHRNFLLVSEAGSFSAAARSHGISQSALSESVAKLEDHYRVQLFDRVARGVLLTEYGQIVLERVKAIRAEYDNTAREIEAQREKSLAELRISCGPRWAINLMPALIASLQNEFRGFNARVVMAHRSQIMDSLQKRETDVGVCGIAKPPQDPGLAYEMLSTVHSNIFAREGHPVHAADAAVDLSEWPWTNLHRSPVEQLLPEDVILKMTRKHMVTLTTDSFTIALRHAALSDNLLIIPEALANLAKSYGLKAVQGHLPIREFRTAVFYHRAIQSRPVIRRLITVIRDWDNGGQDEAALARALSR